jgi:hypothetical protein
MDRDKPKLVFFQQQCDENLPEFLLQHKRDHIKCLSQSFDITVIREPSDYRQVCDKHEPDITLFESGTPFASSRRLEITNTRSHPNIPKIGFLHSDPFCMSRSAFISDMSHWCIDTFFSIATTAREHLPAIANNLYTWPNFADTDIYRDYKQWKSIPVLFTGASFALYPWRQKVARLVTPKYPSLVCPHPGHVPIRDQRKAISGEQYARLLNAASVVPTCGSIAKEVLRKHFEIPACRTCLITEMSPGLQAAGFVDMHNCVTADEHTILAKLEYLFNHPDKLADITNAGYQLVKDRHTLKHRDQLLQWLNLHSRLKADERIIQLTPFEPLRIMHKSAQLSTSSFTTRGIHLELLRQGDASFLSGDYEHAEMAYLKCANYIPWMPEPQVKLALCSLHKGRPDDALHWILKPITFTLSEYKATDPDPVEWAYFILTLICLGRMKEASGRCKEFSWLHHPELDRIRWAVALLQNDISVEFPKNGDAQIRPSVHQLPILSVGEWSERVTVMLQKCKQISVAKKLSARVAQNVAIAKNHIVVNTAEQCQDVQGGQCNVAKLHYVNFRPLIQYGNISNAQRHFTAKSTVNAIKNKLRRLVAPILHGLEAKYGYFLPYNLSIGREEDFFKSIRDLAGHYPLKTALVLDTLSDKYACGALLVGALANKQHPSIFRISLSKLQWRRIRSRSSKNGRVHLHTVALRAIKKRHLQLADVLEMVEQKSKCDGFDCVVMSGGKLRTALSGRGLADKWLLKASLIFMEDINRSYTHDVYQFLNERPEYVLASVNLDSRNGCAVFRRR